jgi:sarcosine oxidase
VAVHEPGAGFVGPEETVAAHLALAEEAGARLEFHTQVLEWELDGPAGAAVGGVSVRTRGGEFRARRLVVCAGAWSARVLEGFGLPLTVERHALHWFAPSGDTAPFRLGRLPVYLWEFAAGSELYGFPLLPGAPGAKVAFFHHGRPADPDHLDREVTTGEGDDLRCELVDRIPNLAGAWISGVACMYTMTPDRHFVIGCAPGTAGRVAMAGGFSGHGFKFAPMVGEILADLATTGHTPWDISLFDPLRFGEPGSIPTPPTERP